MSNRIVQTHKFARGLLARRNEYVRFWLFGRLSIVWDTNRAVPAPIPTGDLIPEEPDGHDSR